MNRYTQRAGAQNDDNVQQPTDQAGAENCNEDSGGRFREANVYEFIGR